jgi:hypothetical protein
MRLLSGLLILAACFVIGCSTDISAHEHLGKELVQNMNQMADAMENMLKKPDLEALTNSETKIKKAAADIDAVTTKIKALPQSTQNALEQKFKGDIEQAKTRIQRLGSKMKLALPNG